MQKNALDLLSEDESRTARAAVGRRVEKRSDLTQPSERLLIAVGGGATASGARVSETTALTVPTVQACVGILADMIGLVPCKLYRKTADNSREEVRPSEHPAAALVTVSPNGHHTAFEFRRFMQTGAGLGGNGYARVFRDQFYQPGELQPLAPCDVQPELLRNRQIVYHVNGERAPLTRADLVHVLALSSNGVSGISPVRAARESIGLSITQRESAGKMFANGARFPGYMTTDQSRSSEQLAAAANSFEQQNGGSLNSGRVPFFANGWKYVEVQGMTMQDAEFLESRKFERSEIAMMYRVPEVLIGSTDKTSSWGTGIEQLTLGFLNFCLNPWLTNWEQALNITLLTADEIAVGYYFKFNRGALLQAALEAQASFFRTMRDIGVYSINDVRRKLEENDLPDAIGDDYSRPFNGSGGTATQTQPAADAATKGNA